MHIKKNTVIPAGFKVTKCPPAAAEAPSLYQLRRQAEERATTEAESEHRAESESESAAEFYCANGYRASGFDSDGNAE